MPHPSDKNGLRLTLRTLLAWMDDTLPPEEVRQIGQQVKESSFAGSLVERIQKVTRRRRITIPPSSGPDAVDANLVARYLDNELPADQVAEYEKRCLTSDVHLAEVASCHQILSMIGQKARVPLEARQRMYRLVRGREAVARAVPSGSRRSGSARSTAAAPAWPDLEPPSRSFWSRSGLPIGVVGLVGLLIVSAWMLTPSGREPALVLSQGQAPESGPVPASPPVALPLPPVVRPEPEPKIAPEPPPEPAPAEPEPQPEVPLAAPIGSAGVVTQAPGILLRWDDGASSWARLNEKDPVRRDDRIVTLAPFRSTLQVGSVTLELVGPVEVRLGAPKAGESVRFELVDGRVVVATGDSPKPLSVVVSGQAVTLTPSGPGRIGIQTVDRRGPGQPVPELGSLRVFVAEGDLSLKVGSKTDRLAASEAITVVLPDQLADRAKGASPKWVTSTDLEAIDQANGKRLARYFKPEYHPIRSLAEAIEDDDVAIRSLAVAGLASIGELELLIGTLNREGDPVLRRAAARALRAYADRGVATATALHEQLVRMNGDAWAGTVETLLAGFTPEQARSEATYAQLVRLLTHEDVGVRELALMQLMDLTRRDQVGYDPDQPEGPGLRTWQELLRNGELAPAPEGPAPKRPH